MLENAKKFIFSRTKPLLFAININGYGLVAFFRFWMGRRQKGGWEGVWRGGELFSGGKTRIVRLLAN